MFMQQELHLKESVNGNPWLMADHHTTNFNPDKNMQDSRRPPTNKTIGQKWAQQQLVNPHNQK
jgi:hypothetical protein